MWEERMLPHLDSNMVWLGLWAVGQRGRREQEMWLLYPSTFQNGTFAELGTPVALSCKLSPSMVELVYASDLQRNLQLWGQFLDPKALAPTLTFLSLSLSLSSSTAQGHISPLFNHLRNKLALQMTFVDCYFAFIHENKNKALLSHKCANWIGWNPLLTSGKIIYCFLSIYKASESVRAGD